ncbi:PREDICTED: brain tumor protein [Rhagoletis zephyria]|uniref:brain tumor protein n=1 Tax=Rhagoletis zephyria TaxID=28612 RepID=UPI0008118A45|nr:PREDICTED: brain tumor protein [Rhagoletis zephyria]XP_017485566.1 PREDICTED: brain tumor protein [Rhagoletis zephyria]XP_017485631.1 PREDICTED: brain tumor protein [Rhagoletis zephyria]XP_017485706.1 PREDICTED: brain tumor protein [Rhagoletis zephyria]XP_017485768.1 PREDICTED: brain tumor protein [Rhagoletis zephyria]
MATSPTPSLDSIRGTNSIESYGEHTGYLSDSPLTLSGSSPPVSDSAICDEFTSAGTGSNQHHPISASVSSSSSSSSSGLSGCGSTSSANSNNSCNNIANGGGGEGIGSGGGGVGCNNSSNGPGVIGSNLNGKGSPCNNLISNSSIVSVSTANGVAVPRCTACKSKQSDAVARCFECISYLCANCVTAHQFMHCFNGHNVSLIKGFDTTTNNVTTTSTTTTSSSPSTNLTVPTSSNLVTADIKLSSSLTMMLQQQQQQQQQQISKSFSQLSKMVLNSHVVATTSASLLGGDSGDHLENNTNNTTICNGEDFFGNFMPQLRSTSFCRRHKNEPLKFNCRTCCKIVCNECVLQEHSVGLHEVEHLQEHQLSTIFQTNSPASSSTFNHQQQTSPETVLQTVLTELRGKIAEIVSLVSSNSDSNSSKIKMQYQKAHNEVNETYQFFCSMLDERKQEVLKELEGLYNAKVASSSVWLQRSKELIEKAVHTCDSLERSTKTHSVADVLMLRKMLEQQLQTALMDMQLPFELEFISNYQSIQAGVRNTFGYIRPGNTEATNGQVVKQPPIARPTQNSSNSSSSNSSLSGVGSTHFGLGLSASLLENAYSSAVVGGVNGVGGMLGRGGTNHGLIGNAGTINTNSSSTFEELMAKRYHGHSTGVIGPYVGVNPYEKWSNGGSDNIFSSADPFSSAQLLNSLTSSVGSAAGGSALGTLNVQGNNTSSDSLMDLTSKLLSTSTYPPKSQIKRQKMIYHCKFGEFGVLEGQFTEPSGVAVNAQNDIIVADTNNHRIQIFDKEGRFKFQFGECGKRDSQLLYPNRVAVVRNSGDIIVTERSPTHQIQIYNQYGQFVRKFGANILQHPRGVTVDNKGRIIVVECKVMRVIIFDQNGNVIHKFGCSKHLEFPNGVVVNDKQEIFISDNRAHCVKVFNYEGQYLRQIGGEGVTNYPIGVGINANGEILIADNHNNFNLTIFTQEGQLVSALESKVKHAQCFDVALMDDGSVVLASKDYRLYIYRYVQVPPIVM